MAQEFKIPEMVYVKFNRRTRDDEEYLLGFMTPYDPDDKKFKDRKITVDRWSDWGRGNKSMLDKQAWCGYNEPMEGFEILHVVSRHRTSNKVFRLKDPRGFELEITAYNICQLIHNATLSNGKVQGECVWARDSNGQNQLLPVDSELYKACKEYTEVRNSRISLRDINRGDVVALHDGRDVQYMGGMYYAYWDSCYNRNSPDYGKTFLKTKREYVFFVKDGETKRDRWSRSDSTLDLKSSVKVGKLIEESDPPLSGDEAAAIVNEEVLSNEAGYGVKGLCFRPKKFTPEDLELFIGDSYEFSEELETEEPDRKAVNTVPFVVAEVSGHSEAQDGLYKFSGQSWRTGRDQGLYTLTKINRETLLESGAKQVEQREVVSQNRYGYGNSTTKEDISFNVYCEDLNDLDWKQVMIRVDGEHEYPVRD